MKFIFAMSTTQKGKQHMLHFIMMKTAIEKYNQASSVTT